MDVPAAFKVTLASSVEDDTFNAEIEHNGEFFAVVTTYDSQPGKHLTIEIYPPEKRTTHKMDLVELQDLLADMKFRIKAYGQKPGIDQNHPFRDGNFDHLKHLEDVNNYLGVELEGCKKELTAVYGQLEDLKRENGILQFQLNRQSNA